MSKLLTKGMSAEEAKRIAQKVAHHAGLQGGNGFRKYSTKKKGGTKQRKLGWFDKVTMLIPIES